MNLSSSHEAWCISRIPVQTFPTKSHLETTRDRIPHWTNGYIGILRAGRDLPTENVAKQVSLGISIQGGWGIPGAQDYSPNQSGVRGQLQ